MYFNSKILISVVLILSVLINPALHLLHVCMESDSSIVHCSSDADHHSCQNEEELNTEQECQICELLATFTVAYSQFDSYNYYLSVVINYKRYSDTFCSLFLSRFSARAPPYL